MCPDTMTQASEPPETEDSLSQLQAEFARLQVEKMRLAQREKVLLQALGKASAQRLASLAGASGVTPLQDLIEQTVSSTARGVRKDATLPVQNFVRKAPIQFRHPQDPGLVWSGRGKTPAWVKQLDQQGLLDSARVAQVS